MSQDKKIIDDICFIPNITDAISFSYKKTIGPLHINKLNIKYNYSYIKDISLIIKNILLNYYTSKNNINNIEEHLNKLEVELYNLFIKLNKTDHIFLIKYINNILQTTHPNIFNTIEILIETINKYFELNETNITLQHYTEDLIYVQASPPVR